MHMHVCVFVRVCVCALEAGFSMHVAKAQRHRCFADCVHSAAQADVLQTAGYTVQSADSSDDSDDQQFL